MGVETQPQKQEQRYYNGGMKALSLPGRETAAGRALFALFNGYHLARQRGNAFSYHNRISIRCQPPRPCPPEPPTPKSPPQKHRIIVPRFRKRRSVGESQEQVGARPGRRTASDILRQVKLDSEHKEVPPHPTKPLLDDKEKARLALLFEWSGRVDKEDLALIPVAMQGKSQPRRRKNTVLGSTEDMENLVEQISLEIEEREQFIKDMDRLGQAEKYKSQVRVEIQQRLKQLQKLDRLIKDEEKERLQPNNS